MKMQRTTSRETKRASRAAARARPPTSYFPFIGGNRGITVILVLVFMGVFAIIMGTVASYTLTQSKAARAKLAKEEAFSIAEAGLEYYHWFLKHNPNDLQNGTGAPGPYTHTVEDPEGGEIGTAELSIDGNIACGEVQSIDITSLGRSNTDPQFTRELFARYAQPSVAEFAYIINSNVWAGADRDIVGPYHSNGGIRMDGTNNSTVTSAVEEWTCTSSFGCSWNQAVDGVWGAGTGSALWEYPVPQFDFDGVAVDLVDLKGKAQADGLYFASVGGDDQRGYRLDLLSDGSVDVYEVVDTNYRWSIHIDETGTWQRDYHVIDDENYVGNFVIPTDCPVVFVEDKVWLEGEVHGKTVIVAADTDDGFDPDIVLQDNITYTTTDGSDGLTAVAENSVHVGFDVPTNMTLNGIFIAQEGYYGRNLYPCWYSPYDQRNSLTMHGTIVSNQRVGTQWSYSTGGCWSDWSGFSERDNTYDRLLALDPPPFTPAASPDEEFILWREE